MVSGIRILNSKTRAHVYETTTNRQHKSKNISNHKAISGICIRDINSSTKLNKGQFGMNIRRCLNRIKVYETATK